MVLPTSSPSHLVNLYACDCGNTVRNLALGEILGLDTLDECLNMHQQYIIITDPSPTNIQPAHDGPNSKPDCRSCVDLHTLIHDMLNEGCGMHDFINGCESSADAVVNAECQERGQVAPAS